MSTVPQLGNLRREPGIAGQEALSVEVTYPGEDSRRVTFVGSVYGGPVVMVLSSGAQTFVSDPERFGPFGTEWVRRFFTGDES